MTTQSLIRPALALVAVACAALSSPLHADPTTYHYDGDLQPSEGDYAGWFTTVGPNSQGISYFGHTTWSSDGDVLTMSTSYSPSEGIWFGRTSGYGDPSSFNLADTASGNWVRARVALAPGATDWTLYWYDASGYGSIIDFTDAGFTIYMLGSPGGTLQGFFTPVADMTSFHTFTSYVLAGQVSYFFDNTYLGGGHAVEGASNFLIIGDDSASTVSGTGSMLVDYMTIITAVGDTPPSSIPEPAAAGALAGLAVLGLGLTRRRRRGRV